jgi:hypothetical protein
MAHSWVDIGDEAGLRESLCKEAKVFLVPWVVCNLLGTKVFLSEPGPT